MADWSRFAEPTGEWIQHEKQYGFPTPAAIDATPPEQLQRDTNDFREKASEQNILDESLYDVVDIKTIEIQSQDGYMIPTRIYFPKGFTPTDSPLPIYLFFHGGGFIYGTLSSEDAACARIVAQMPIVVVNICYRHTPQFKYPKMHEDAFAAYDWVGVNARSLGGDPGNIVVGGISAGANLAAAIVLRNNRARRERSNPNGDPSIPIKGQLLCIPWVIIRPESFPYKQIKSPEKYSRRQCANAPVLDVKVEAFFRELMGLTDSDRAVDVGCAPDDEVKDSPKTAFLIAGNDPIRDDGLLYAENLYKNGVPVKVHVFQGLPHGFRRFNDLPSSRRWDELIVEAIKWTLQGSPSDVNDEFIITTESADV